MNLHSIKSLRLIEIFEWLAEEIHLPTASSAIRIAALLTACAACGCLLPDGGPAFAGDQTSESRKPLEGYATFGEMEARLKALAESPHAELNSLGKTLGDRDLWLLTIGDDGDAAKPAILVMGNVLGSHLLGRELSLRMAEKIVHQAQSDETAAELLSKYTLYFIPSPTPDATEKNFADPVREHTGNLKATDDDRDFEIGEDPPADLNGDGWISMMRVSEQFGTHRGHPSDSRVLIPIDSKKREVGQYRLFVESFDSDKDEQFGEDGSEGVDFNRNFTFNYDFFGKGTGPHQVSEQETRAVADFMFDHPNIAFVWCFSPEDNLFHPWKGSPQTDAARIKTKVMTGDQKFLDDLAGSYRELHGGKSAPSSPSGAGSFSEWAYFHYGRWTFAARGWWVPPAPSKPAKANEKETEQAEQTEPAASGDEQTEPVASGDEQAEKPSTDSDANQVSEQASQRKATDGERLEKDDKRGAEVLNALAWFESQGIDAFIDWQPFDHPDFPGKQVEIGGLKPHLLLNPPANLIDPLVQPHLDFLNQLIENWPRIEIRDVEATALGPGLFDVRCKVVNVGSLPTMPLMGSTNRQWYPIQIELTGVEDARWIEGAPRQSVGRLAELGGSEEVQWVFLLNEPSAEGNRLSISATAPTLHAVEATVDIATE
jgi:hypothetical protein